MELFILLVVVGGILLSFMREVKQYERGGVLTIGKYTSLRNRG